MKQNLNKKSYLVFIPIIIGILTSFSLPPYNLVIINFITFPFLIYLLILNHNNKPISFLIGWSFGFGYFLSSLYWVANALTFDENLKVFIPIGTVLVPSFLALFYGLIFFITSFFKLKYNFSSIIIFAIIFSVVEFFRGYILGGFPWNLIGSSWSNYINFIQILPFMGTYAFNLFSITLFLSSLVLIFKIPKNIKYIYFLSIILMIGINFYYGSNVIKKYNKINVLELDTKIKIISPKVEIKRFYEANSSEKIIFDLINLSEPEKHDDAIFIFPEGILTDIYLEELEKFKFYFQENFTENHKIILGINSNKNGKIYNSMVLIDKDLNILSSYKKNKLVPFGEFIPFENFLSQVGLKKITKGYQSFSFDNKRDLIKYGDINFLPLICYEIIYSGNLKKKNKKFNFILNISEDGWFGESIGIHQHLSHSIFRSLEEGKFLIRAANNGISAYISPKGEILKKIESTSRGVISVENFKETNETLFNKYGNNLFLYFLLIYISLFFFLKKMES